MTNKQFTGILILSLILSGAVTSLAYAEEQDNARSNTNRYREIEEKDNATSSLARTSERGNATSSEAREKSRKDRAESHRSEVASFVQSLLKLADREPGIGERVRVVAKTQNESASTSAEAIDKVERIGKVRSFLFGSDYKNLGHLRRELATTTRSIANLKELLSETTSDSAKAELSAQIKTLEDLQLKIETFVKSRENSFSLFGWLNKMFSN